MANAMEFNSVVLEAPDDDCPILGGGHQAPAVGSKLGKQASLSMYINVKISKNKLNSLKACLLH